MGSAKDASSSSSSSSSSPRRSASLQDIEKRRAQLPRSVRWRIQLDLLQVPMLEKTNISKTELVANNRSRVKEQRRHYCTLVSKHRRDLDSALESTHNNTNRTPTKDSAQQEEFDTTHHDDGGRVRQKLERRRCSIRSQTEMRRSGSVVFTVSFTVRVTDVCIQNIYPSSCMSV